MLLHKTSNQPKFRQNRLKNAWDIYNQKFVLPEKVGQSSPKIFGGYFSPKPLTMQNFVAIY